MIVVAIVFGLLAGMFVAACTASDSTRRCKKCGRTMRIMHVSGNPHNPRVFYGCDCGGSSDDRE